MRVNGYWKDLKDIIESGGIDLQNKNEEISKLNRFVLYDIGKNTFYFKEEILSEIDSFIIKHNLNLLNLVEKEVASLKCWKDFKKSGIVTLEFIIYLILLVVITASYKGHVIRYTIVSVQILNLISSLFYIDSLEIDTNTIVEDVEKLVNNSIHSCIGNETVTSIGVRGFSKFEKNTLRIIQTILNKLVDLELLLIKKEKSFVKYNASGIPEKVEKRKFPIKTLKINVPLRKDSIFNFLSNNWPSFVPVKVTPDTPVYSSFKKGEFKVIATDKLLRSLNAVGKVGVKYDWELFSEAKENIMSQKNFYYAKNYDIEDVMKKRAKTSQLLLEVEGIIKSQLFFEKHNLICFHSYFKKYDLKLKNWYIEIASVWGKSSHSSQANTFRFYQKFYKKNNDIIEILIPHIMMFIVDALNKNRYNYSEILNSYLEVNVNSIGEISDDARFKEVRNQIVLIFRELGLKKITKFSFIFNCFIQKKYPFMELWNAYKFKEFSPENSLLSKKNTLEKDFRYWNGIANNLMEMKFKSMTMYLFRNHTIYFLPQIGVNSRHLYSHYMVHPLSGNLFKFAKTVPEPLTERGLLHLKRAFLCQFNSGFKTLKELDQLVINMDLKQLESMKYDSIGFFCYYDALKKAEKKLPCNTFVRLDECGSGLTYQGILAGCSYLQKITNLTDPSLKYEPYSIITEDYIKPAFNEFLNKWNENFEFMNDDSNISLYNLVKKTIGEALNRKKFVKYVIMPHTYNLTHEGVEEKVMEVLINAHPQENWLLLNKSPFIKSLSLKIWHAVFKASPKLKRLRDILNTTQELIIVFIGLLLKYDNNVYTTVLNNYDHCSMWDYKEKRYIDKKLWSPERGYSETIKIAVNTSETKKDDCLRGFLPLLTQSRDSDIIRLASDTCINDLGIDAPSSHDAAACHPNNVDEVHKALKEAFYKIFGEGKVTNKKYLEDLWLNPTLDQTTKVLRNMKKDIIKKEDKLPFIVDKNFRRLIFGTSDVLKDKREDIDEIIKDTDKLIISVNRILELNEEKGFQELNEKLDECPKLQLEYIYSKERKESKKKKMKKWEAVESKLFKSRDLISLSSTNTNLEVSLEVQLEKIKNNFKKIDDIGKDLCSKLLSKIDLENSLEIKHRELTEKKKKYLKIVKELLAIKSKLRGEKLEETRDVVETTGDRLRVELDECSKSLKEISEYKLEKRLIEEKLQFVQAISKDILLSLKEEISWSLEYLKKMKNVSNDAIEIKCNSALIKNKWDDMWIPTLKENEKSGFREVTLNVEPILDTEYHYFYE